MDVLYREHERLFLSLRLQHPWLKWCCLLPCTNCQNHWVLCCLMWEGSYWLVTYGWPCAWSPVSPGNLLQSARHRHHWSNMSCSLYLFSSSLEWLRCRHIWQIVITSVKSWIHGWVPWTTLIYRLLDLAPMSSPVQAILGIARLLLTCFWL